MSNGPVVLYAWGLFESAYSAGIPPAEQVLLVGPSGFNTVILWTIHVDAQGNLTYNDPTDNVVTNGVFNPAFKSLGAEVLLLKAAGVQKVLIGIGSGGGTNADFTNIVNLMNAGQGKALQASFSALQAGLNTDGFDFDIENFNFDDNQVGPVGDFAGLLSTINGKSTITFCPYNNEGWWVEVLQYIYQKNNNSQLVSWFNLQCYAGGGTNQPQNWVATLAAATNTGVTSPAAFIVPGYWCTNDYGPGNSPAQIQDIFAGLTKTDPGINGGFIWNSFDIFKGIATEGTPTNYAQAVIAGLKG
jgi:hypothetical protein